ncbi:hypothetical protein Ancab_037101 [Ancistrocladus abbreviatus]
MKVNDSVDSSWDLGFRKVEVECDSKLCDRNFPELTRPIDHRMLAWLERLNRCLTDNGRSGYGRVCAPNSRGDIWISFLGPDKIGKRKITEALADVVCGSKEYLIAVNFCCQERAVKSKSMFRSRGLDNFDKVSTKTMVGYIAEELRKKPFAIVFLQSVEEANLVVQSSLSHAIQTGKFLDSHGREISITNMIFMTTSSVAKDEKNLACEKEFVKFSEQRILEAKSWQMQIIVGCVQGDFSGSISSIVSLSSKEGAILLNKRKLYEASDPKEDLSTKQDNKMPTNCFDLNSTIGRV